LAKTLPSIKLNDDFPALFDKRPHIDIPTFDNLVALFNQLVVETTAEDVDLRGQSPGT
jgi:hypothetical protein